jgi:excisionase family DNA binding protein
MPDAPPPAQFYTVAEVAKILGDCSPKTVWHLCRQHKIPATMPAGRWLIPVKEFDAWLKAGANNALATHDEAASA